jgi:hypothetical protein
MTTTRPWFCDRTDCPSGSHDTYSARRYGCDSGAAREDARRYRKRLRVGTSEPKRVDSTGIARRIEACHFMGHTGVDIGNALGVTGWAINRLRRRIRPQVTTRSRDRMIPVLERLAMQSGDDTRTRMWARREGFRPLLAWVDIDDPDEQPPVGTPGEPPTLRAVDDLDLDALYVAVRERRRPLGELDARARSYVVERAWRVRLEEGYTGRELLYKVAELLHADPMLVSRTHASAVTRKNRALKEAS